MKELTDSESTLKEFFLSWKAQDWKKALSFVQITWKEDQSEASAIEYLKNYYGNTKLMKWEIIKVNKISTTCHDIIFMITISLVGKVFIQKRGARILKELAPYHPHLDGTWGVNPISVLKVIKRKKK